jgi:diguanylate cyclase (GGDEF)-like protein
MLTVLCQIPSSLKSVYYTLYAIGKEVPAAMSTHSTTLADATDGNPRFWALMQRCCQIAIGVSVLFFFVFLLLGSPALAWANILSVALYIAAYFALNLGQNRLAAGLMAGEVLAFSGLSALMLGWEAGFHYYGLIFIPAFFAALKNRQACLLTGALWAYYALLFVTARYVDPVQPVAPAALSWIHVFNFSAVLGVFGYLALVYARMASATRSKLRQLTTTDTLTRFFNRRYMIEQAGKEIERARRNNRPLSFFVLDLDHFKVINDTHGHDVGDEVLIAATRIIESQLRAQDTIARWGGEEFLTMLPETGIDEAVLVAERIRRAIMTHIWQHNGIWLSVTISIGVSEYRSGDDLSSVVARADRGLYTGKNAGRNRVEAAVA